jgi:AraC family transcriptional regulator of adaptative response / DNA-3-methyladenine glycosylase II
MTPLPDAELCYRAVQSRDSRFDGWFITAVTSTRIYCRPSCPAVTPKRTNVRFYPTAAAAQQAGFRACLRCLPDAAPGSPEWNLRADLVGRAMRMIADGIVEREGVGGLSRRLGYSERHVHRQLAAELGAGPLALARAQRAQTARILIETTSLSFADVAFAAGFASVRQFNDTIREVFATTPTALRTKRLKGADPAPGTLTLRLPYRAPFDATGLWRFLASRAVTGIEEAGGPVYRRSLRLSHGTGVVTLSPGDGHVLCTLRLEDLRDLGSAVQRCRRLLDLDADPEAIEATLSRDDVLARIARPGRRLPGAVDGTEIALRAVVGQQISVPAARTVLGRIVADHGTELNTPDDAVTHTFPTAEALAEADPATLPMPESRKRTIHAVCTALASGDLVLDPGADPAEAEETLLALPGVGPWTAGYIAMRAFSLPDRFLPTDLGVRHGAAALGLPHDPEALAARATWWAPWRSYAVLDLWNAAYFSRSAS